MDLPPEIDDVVRVNPLPGADGTPYIGRVVDVMEWPGEETSVAVESKTGAIEVVMLRQLDEVDRSHRRRH